MRLHSRKASDKVLLVVVFFFCLFSPSMSLAGSSPVVTVGDSSSGGAVNFDPAVVPGGPVANGDNSGVTAVRIATAISNGSLGQDQIANGFGSGGAAVTLSAEVAEKVQNAASSASVLVDGQSMTVLEALLSLSTSQDLGDLQVAMPSGVSLALSSLLANVSAALTSNNPTLIGTALNDAAIALSQVLKDGENLSDLRSACEAVVGLLDVVRSG